MGSPEIADTNCRYLMIEFSKNLQKLQSNFSDENPSARVGGLTTMYNVGEDSLFKYLKECAVLSGD